MNKSELVDFVAKKVGITKSDAIGAIDAMIQGITQTLKDGNKVTLVGFGTFESKVRISREGRNPRTGDKIQIPTSIIPSFKAGKVLKNMVNQHN